MGKLNILNGGWSGSVGKLTGVFVGGDAIVKQKIFKKKHPIEVQQNSVRAFEALNRISSAIAKKFWYYLNLNDKKQLKHNAVAQFLSPVIKNHQFEPQNIAELIPETQTEIIKLFTYQPTNNIVDIELENLKANTAGVGFGYLILVFSSNGKVFYSNVLKTAHFQTRFFVPLGITSNIHVLTITSELQRKKHILSQFELKTIING